MTGEKRWYHAYPVPLERVTIAKRWQHRNQNLSAITLTKIKTAFCRNKPQDYDRPNRLGQRWHEGIYVEGNPFQLNCKEKDGLVVITSASYDKRAYRGPKKRRKKDE